MNDLRFILTFSHTSQTVTLSRATYGADAPDGWDESMIKFERSKKYYGVLQSWTIPLKFIKGIAELLRTEFYTYGLDSQVTIQIDKLNKITLQYWTAYTGSLDFSTFKDTDDYCECNFIDGGLTDLIKKNEDLEVTFTRDTEGEILQWQWAEYITMNAYCYRFEDYLTKILDLITGGKITDGTYAIKSDFFDLYSSAEGAQAEGNSLVITSGREWIAGSDENLPLITSEYKTTFSDFWNTINSIFCLGMSVETIAGKQTVVIETRDYFYDDSTEITDVGEVGKINISLSGEHNFSKIKCGYTQYDYGDPWGYGDGNQQLNWLEYITEVNWTTPNKSTTQEYNLAPKYRADWQGLYAYAIQNYLTSPPTTDDAIIDDIWIWQVVWNESLQVYNIAYTHLGLKKKSSGMAEGESFNADLSPLRCLYRHKNYLESCLFGFDGQNITFSSGYNDEIDNIVLPIKTIMAEPPTNACESDPVLIQTDYAYFLPLLVDIEAPYPSTMAQLIAANPHGYITFNYNGQDFKGFIQSMEVKLSAKASAKYQLLLTADNDLTKLIR